MNLTPCPACATPLSPAAKTCPCCGHTMPRKPMPRALLWTIIGIAVAVLLVLWIEAVHAGNEETRKRARQFEQDMDDIRAGTYRAPVRVRLDD